MTWIDARGTRPADFVSKYSGVPNTRWVPNKSEGDDIFIHWANLSFLGEFLKICYVKISTSENQELEEKIFQK